MTREEAISIITKERDEDIFGGWTPHRKRIHEAFTLAIEALKAQEWDEVVFDMNEFFSIIDNGKITVMRKGRGKVTVERPVMQMETTICSYGERGE